MKLEYDSEADAAYIYIEEIPTGGVKKTISVDQDINIDLDSKGHIVGIEVLSASKRLSKKLLKTEIVLTC